MVGATSFLTLNRAAMRLFFAQHHEFDPVETERHIFFLETLLMSVFRRWVLEKPRNVPASHADRAGGRGGGRLSETQRRGAEAQALMRQGRNFGEVSLGFEHSRQHFGAYAASGLGRGMQRHDEGRDGASLSIANRDRDRHRADLDFLIDDRETAGSDPIELGFECIDIGERARGNRSSIALCQSLAALIGRQCRQKHATHGRAVRG